MGKNGQIFACENRAGRLRSLKNNLSQNKCDSNI